MTESVESATGGDSGGNRTGKRKSGSGAEEEEDSCRLPSSKRCRRDSQSSSVSLSQRFWELEQQMCRELSALSFSSPVTHIYNPLDYARQPHQSYLNSYVDSPKRVMFFGMNPGPFGMAQTGVRVHPASVSTSCSSAFLHRFRTRQFVIPQNSNFFECLYQTISTYAFACECKRLEIPCSF